MAFAVVKFTLTKEVSVVPIGWHQGTNCLWPPERERSRLAPFVQNGIAASEAWNSYPIQVLGVYGNQCFWV